MTTTTVTVQVTQGDIKEGGDPRNALFRALRRVIAPNRSMFIMPLHIKVGRSYYELPTEAVLFLCEHDTAPFTFPLDLPTEAVRPEILK